MRKEGEGGEMGARKAKMSKENDGDENGRF